MIEPDLSTTVATLERTLAADRALADALEHDPRLRARAAKLRARCQETVAELGRVLAATGGRRAPSTGIGTGLPPGELRHLNAKLASYEQRLGSLTYDAAIVDLGGDPG